MQKTICVIGGDARQQAAARALRRAGYSVLPPSGAGRAGCLLLPLPLDRLTPELSCAFAAARPGTLALGGRFGAEVQAAARQAGLETVDYFRRPELAALNAVPTAEGCLCLLMQLRDRTLWQSPVLVLGYGRIGRALAERLSALGAWVTVAARSPEQRANARCAGCRAAPLEQLERLLPGFDAVVNTIPAPVLTAPVLAALRPGSLIVDLASAPGGTDFAAAAALGHTALLAPGLPARCAPDSAGEYLAETVLEIIREGEAAG